LSPRIGRSRAFSLPWSHSSGCWRTARCDARPLGAMPGRRQQLLQDHRVGRRLIGHDLARRSPGRADGLLEEAAGGPRVPPYRHKDVDDLSELVDRAVDVAPPTGDLHIGLIHLPAVTNSVPARPGGLGEQRREPQYPPVDGDVVNLDAAFGEQLLDVAVRQAVTQVPAHCQDDHVGWEAEASEGRLRNGLAGPVRAHCDSLPAQGSLTAGATVPHQPRSSSRSRAPRGARMGTFRS
jgi:hypothetical protein